MEAISQAYPPETIRAFIDAVHYGNTGIMREMLSLHGKDLAQAELIPIPGLAKSHADVLYLSVVRNNCQAAELLLENGASTNKKYVFNFQEYDITHFIKSPEMAALLQKYNKNALYGTKITELRKAKKISANELAYICGCYRTQIEAIEKGLIAPSPELHKAILKAVDAYNFQGDDVILDNLYEAQKKPQAAISKTDTRTANVFDAIGSLTSKDDIIDFMQKFAATGRTGNKQGYIIRGISNFNQYSQFISNTLGAHQKGERKDYRARSSAIQNYRQWFCEISSLIFPQADDKAYADLLSGLMYDICIKNYAHISFSDALDEYIASKPNPDFEDFGTFLAKKWDMPISWLATTLEVSEQLFQTGRTKIRANHSGIFERMVAAIEKFEDAQMPDETKNKFWALRYGEVKKDRIETLADQALQIFADKNPSIISYLDGPNEVANYAINLVCPVNEGKTEIQRCLIPNALYALMLNASGKKSCQIYDKLGCPALRKPSTLLSGEEPLSLAFDGPGKDKPVPTGDAFPVLIAKEFSNETRVQNKITAALLGQPKYHNPLDFIDALRKKTTHPGAIFRILRQQIGQTMTQCQNEVEPGDTGSGTFIINFESGERKYIGLPERAEQMARYIFSKYDLNEPAKEKEFALGLMGKLPRITHKAVTDLINNMYKNGECVYEHDFIGNSETAQNTFIIPALIAGDIKKAMRKCAGKQN